MASIVIKKFLNGNIFYLNQTLYSSRAGQTVNSHRHSLRAGIPTLRINDERSKVVSVEHCREKHHPSKKRLHSITRRASDCQSVISLPSDQ